MSRLHRGRRQLRDLLTDTARDRGSCEGRRWPGELAGTSTRPTATRFSPRSGCSLTRSATRHVETCCATTSTSANPCLAQYGLEEKLKELLARKCGGEHAPHTLKAKLRDQIRLAVLEQAEVRVESGPHGTSIEVRSARSSGEAERHGRTRTDAKGRGGHATPALRRVLACAVP